MQRHTIIEVKQFEIYQACYFINYTHPPFVVNLLAGFQVDSQVEWKKMLILTPSDLDLHYFWNDTHLNLTVKGSSMEVKDDAKGASQLSC